MALRPVKGRAVGEWHGSGEALPFLKATSEVAMTWKFTLSTRFLLRCLFPCTTTFHKEPGSDSHHLSQLFFCISLLISNGDARCWDTGDGVEILACERSVW